MADKEKIDCAIILFGGLQYQIKEGDEILVNRLKNEVGEKISIKEVLFVKEGEKNMFGRPYVENVNVEAEVISHVKGPKVVIFKKKAKKHYKKKAGHRQPLTKLKIQEITIA